MEIFVKAKTRAKKEKIEKIDETHFKISVVEPPENGKANKAIIKVIAEYFDISLSEVLFVSGFSSKQKKFKID